MALTRQEGDLLRAAVQAACDEPFFDEAEFLTLMGLTRSEMRAVLERWPDDDPDHHRDQAVNNALVNLLGYPHREWDAWREFSDATPEDLARVYARWCAETGRGSPTGYFDDIR